MRLRLYLDIEATMAVVPELQELIEYQPIATMNIEKGGGVSRAFTGRFVGATEVHAVEEAMPHGPGD